MENNEIMSVEFDESNFSKYNLVLTSILLLCFVVTIPLIPVWWVTSGWYHKTWFDKQTCTLKEKSLYIKQGIWFQTEKNIPLDKITDVTMKQGPIARLFNVYYVLIETAGNSTGMAEGTMVGVKEPQALRDRLLAQRDQLSMAQTTSQPLEVEDKVDMATLNDLLEVLKRIEAKL